MEDGGRSKKSRYESREDETKYITSSLRWRLASDGLNVIYSTPIGTNDEAAITE